MPAALLIENLVKSYGPVQAVRGVSFTVQTGEIFGLLGPNGAGKINHRMHHRVAQARCAGSITVCGLDACRGILGR